MNAADMHDAEKCASYMKALGDPCRLRIIKAVRFGEMTVSDIAILLEMDVALVSHHLRVLYHSGILVTRREGKFIYYSVTPEMNCNKGKHTGLDFGCCKLDLPKDEN